MGRETLRPVLVRAGWVATAAVVLAAITGCGQTAESYCHGIYAGGQTPTWAVKELLQRLSLVR
jgi:hypothetical protein